MKTLHFDVFAGISGDMTLGALVNAGCPLEVLQQQLSALNIPGFGLEQEKVRRGALSGTKITVHVDEDPHVHRTLQDVLDIVSRTTWPENVARQIEAAFTHLAHAEGKVHDRPHDSIHFHEVGSYDAIVDLAGSLYALHCMEIESFTCSPLHVGTGILKGTRHGTIPIPSPATTLLLDGFQLYSTGLQQEQITPTGACLLKTLAQRTSPMPAMELQAIGYGAGTRDTPEIANLLRVLIGETGGRSTDRVVVIEANVDDMNPEWLELLFEQLFEAGAADVSVLPVQMKKQRSGIIIQVVAPVGLKETLSVLLLQHSTTIGVRMQEFERRILQRESTTMETPYGPVEGKLCWGHGIDRRFSPEYESCKTVARTHGLPIRTVYEAATLSFHQTRDGHTE